MINYQSKVSVPILFLLFSLCVFKPATTFAQTDFTNADGSPFHTTYCYADSTFEIIGIPTGGAFSGLGVTNKNGKWYFNPVTATIGNPIFPQQYVLTYTPLDGAPVSKVVLTQKPLTRELFYDSVTCNGHIFLDAEMSYAGNYEFIWSPTSNLYSPDKDTTSGQIFNTTTFTTKVKDLLSGCIDSSKFTVYYNPGTSLNLKITSNAGAIDSGGVVTLYTSGDNNYHIRRWFPFYLFTNDTAQSQQITMAYTTRVYATAISEYGCWETANTLVWVNPASITGVNSLAKEISIYPNPTTDYITISAVVPVDVSILSINGKLIIQRRNANKISIKELAAGTYIIKVTDANNNILRIEKITKN